MSHSIKITNSLVKIFEEELFFIKKSVFDFAQKNPGVSGSLGISEQAIHDPNITRLIESVALLNAGLVDRIDHSREDFYANLLELIYPHYLRAKPAFTMLKLDPESDLTESVTIPSNTSFEFAVVTDSGEEQKAIFRTGNAFRLEPYAIDNVQIAIAPFDKKYASLSKNASAMLAITLKTNDPDILFSDIGMDYFEFFLSGDDSVIAPLYDNFYSNMSHIIMEVNGKFIEFNLSKLTSPFEGHLSLLPFESRSFLGFQILTELFLYADAFKKLKLNIKDYVSDLSSDQVKIYLFFNKMPVHTVRNLTKENINLFCVPVFNMYQKIAEPLKIDDSKMAYDIVIDSELKDTALLYSIDKVMDITQGKGEEVFHIYQDKYQNANVDIQWQLKQHYDCSGEQKNALSVARILPNVAEEEEFSPRIFELILTCADKIDFAVFNRNTTIECIDAISMPAAISMFRRISSPVIASSDNVKHAVILSHLQFNYQAIFGASDPLQAFKNILSLYNFSAGSVNQAYIDSLEKITREQTIAPIRLSGISCHTFGTRIDIYINTSKLISCSVLVFAQFLDRFFSCFSTYNTFIQVAVHIEGRERETVVFPRRSGCKTML